MIRFEYLIMFNVKLYYCLSVIIINQKYLIITNIEKLLFLILLINIYNL